MAGIRRFDCDDILDKAARVFWRDGYDGASIQALEAETGLGRGSLYNAFGDKAALFLSVLDRYAATEGAAPLVHLSQPDARAGLEAMLRAMAQQMNKPGRPRGCLLTNTCLGTPGEPAVKARVAQHLARLQEVLEAHVQRAASTCQIAPATDPVALARFYAAVARGLGASHRGGADLAALEDVIDVAMRAWPDAIAAGGVGDDPA